MMLTPDMISSKRFDKQMGGYKQDEVESFLRQVADQVAELTAQKEEADKKVAMLAEKIEQYKEDEDSLRSALIGAQKLGDSVIRESKAKAEYILRDAKVKSDRMMENMQKNIEREQVALVKMQKEVTKFKNRLLTLYRQHLEMIGALPDYEEPAPQAEEPTDNFALHEEEDVKEEPINTAKAPQQPPKQQMPSKQQPPAPPQQQPQKQPVADREVKEEEPVFHTNLAMNEDANHEENQPSYHTEEIQIGQVVSPSFVTTDTQTYQPANFLTAAQAASAADSKFGPLKFGEGFDVERAESAGKSLFAKKKHR